MVGLNNHRNENRELLLTGCTVYPVKLLENTGVRSRPEFPSIKLNAVFEARLKGRGYPNKLH